MTNVKICLFMAIAMISSGLKSQENIELKLTKKQIKLNDVEHHLATNKIAPLQCFNQEDQQPSTKFGEPHESYTRSSNPDDIFVFNVFFHVVNLDNGQRDVPITQDNLLSGVANLNKHFNPFNIFFKFRGSSAMNSTQSSNVYINGSNTFDDLITSSQSQGIYDANALNIFIVSDITYSTSDNRKFAGIAKKPGISSVIKDTYLLTSTLTHEIGHNFLLHHTYRFSDSSNCNLFWLNDEVADTLPTKVYDAYDMSSDCETYTGPSNTTCNYNFSNMPVKNFMSPNVMPCRSIENAEFSSGQGQRMRNSIVSYTLYDTAQAPLNELYQPYQGNYSGNIFEIMKFQKGFNYEFVECDNTNAIVSSYTPNETPVGHPFNTAIKILEVSTIDARNCNNPNAAQLYDSSILSFGRSLGSDYKLISLDKTKESPSTKDSYYRLSSGYNVVISRNNDGRVTKRIIYKSDY